MPLSLRMMDALSKDPGQLTRVEPLLLTDLHDSAARAAAGCAWLCHVRHLEAAGLSAQLRRGAGGSCRSAPGRLASCPRALDQRRFGWRPGVDPAADATRIALYVHYSATGQVSDMVRYQLAQLANSASASSLSPWRRTSPRMTGKRSGRLCALVVQRRELRAGFRRLARPDAGGAPALAGADELMLANDSVLGPIHPLAPVIERMRAGGDGLFGLTESLQGGAHLQSYMLLARGPTAVADLMGSADAVCQPLQMAAGADGRNPAGPLDAPARASGRGVVRL